MKLILASSSPRRYKILSEAGYDFDVIHPAIDESRLGDEAPADYVTRLALKKATSIDSSSSVVIGADTVVVLGNEFLNKPESKADALAILSKLSGKRHTVYTGIALACGICGQNKSACDRTDVCFNDLTESAILRYIKSGEPLDKAGAYGIQGIGSFLVYKIEGELDTVIGFPMKTFKPMLEEHTKCLTPH